MRTMVLVHGAWHGPSCCAAVRGVRPGLDDAGVPAVAVDLPGPDVPTDAAADSFHAPFFSRPAEVTGLLAGLALEEVPTC